MESASVDYSRIRPLSAYPATQCPVRLQYDLLPPPGTIPVEAAAADQERVEQGISFEQAMLAELARLHPDAVLVPDNWRAVEPTLAAMRDGAPLVLGGRLPDDLEGRRAGRPDLLVRVDGGYLPGDVKWHGMTESRPGPARWSPLADPWPHAAVEEPGLRLKADRERTDALQLAHYWRMLEHHGLTPQGPARGVILDRQQRLWWIDLDQPRHRVWWQEEPATWLEVYDHEFAFRRDIASHTQRRIDGEDLPRKVDPVWIGECSRCPWREVCRAELEEADHVSLLSGSTWERYVEHRRREVLTRRRVAELDPVTALAVDELTEAMWRRLDEGPAAALLADVLDRRPGVVAALADLGVATCGDFRARLDPATASYRGARVGRLLPLVDEARAAISGPHRRRGAGSLDLPGAVVEVDVDMECDADGRAYLWGALASVAGEEPAYVAIDRYDELTDEVEAEVFVRLLDHLADLRSRAADRGGVLRVYHWTGAELAAMKRIVAKGAHPRLPSPAELAETVAAEWVDLWSVHRAAVVTGAPTNGLKVAATGIGFAWEVDDPGGDFSMLQHAAAVGGDAAAVEWLRSYNRDDVRATHEIRRWLREHVAGLPRIEDWVPPAPGG